MTYRLKLNECDYAQYDDKHGDMDIPSVKAVKDTLVEEKDDLVIKSRRQIVGGRPYIICAEFPLGGVAHCSDLLCQVIDLTENAKKVSA